MKISTYTETVEIVDAWLAGKLKAVLKKKCMTPECARQRISRFRREHGVEYKRLLKCHVLSLHKPRRRVLN